MMAFYGKPPTADGPAREPVQFHTRVYSELPKGDAPERVCVRELISRMRNYFMARFDDAYVASISGRIRSDDCVSDENTGIADGICAYNVLSSVVCTPKTCAWTRADSARKGNVSFTSDRCRGVCASAVLWDRSGVATRDIEKSRADALERYMTGAFTAADAAAQYRHQQEAVTKYAGRLLVGVGLSVGASGVNGAGNGLFVRKGDTAGREAAAAAAMRAAALAPVFVGLYTGVLYSIYRDGPYVLQSQMVHNTSDTDDIPVHWLAGRADAELRLGVLRGSAQAYAQGGLAAKAAHADAREQAIASRVAPFLAHADEAAAATDGQRDVLMPNKTDYLYTDAGPATKCAAAYINSKCRHASNACISTWYMDGLPHTLVEMAEPLPTEDTELFMSYGLNYEANFSDGTCALCVRDQTAKRDEITAGGRGGTAVRVPATPEHALGGGARPAQQDKRALSVEQMPALAKTPRRGGSDAPPRGDAGPARVEETPSPPRDALVDPLGDMSYADSEESGMVDYGMMPTKAPATKKKDAPLSY